MPMMPPALPVTPEAIAAAGAAIVHLHVGNPEDGRPVQDPPLFTEARMILGPTGRSAAESTGSEDRRARAVLVHG